MPQEESQEKPIITKEEVLRNLMKESLMKVTSASFKIRKSVFLEKLSNCIENEGFQDAHLKGIVKIIKLTIWRYRDKKSRYLVVSFVQKVLAKYGVNFGKLLLSEVQPQAVGLAKSNSSYAGASAAVFLLSWCNEVSKSINVNQEDFHLLVEVQILAYSAVCKHHSRRAQRISNTAKKILMQDKKPEIFLKYIEVILNNSKFETESMSFIGLIFQYLTSHKAISLVDDLIKKKLLDLFIRNCIQTKIAAPKHSLEQVKPMLKYLNHGDFQEIFPDIKKGLLRNPETILQAVGYFFFGLSIDLSQYIDELSQSIPVHFTSQNASLRDDAVFAVEKIAQQCSDHNAVCKLINQIFKILSGSEGKLSLPEQRTSVFSAIENIANISSTAANMEMLATFIFEKMYPFLLEEGHEGALIKALGALKSWAKFFTVNLPTNFVDVVKKGVNAKSSTPTIRANYFQMAKEAIKGNNVVQSLQLLDMLVQTVEKSVPHQVCSVYESLAASTLVACISALDNSKDSKLDSFWSFVLHHTKKPLLSEKFMSAANKEQLNQLMKFTTILFTSHYEKVAGKNVKPWHNAFSTLLLRGDFETVKQTKSLITKVIAYEDLNELPIDIFNEIHSFLIKSDAERPTELSRIPDCYLFLASCYQGSGERFLIDCVFKVHHPSLVENSPDLFKKMAFLMHVDLSKFVSDHSKVIMDMFLNIEVVEKIHINTLTTLLSISSSLLIPLFMEMIKESLKNPVLKQVSLHEFGILNTPEGEVYDQTIFESAKEMKQANVKRESKVYSFKEQNIEMELREELKKNKGENKIELNAKQKEQLEILKNQEKEVRNRLKILSSSVLKQVTLLNICFASKAVELQCHYADLIHMLLDLSKYLMVATHVVPCYIRMSQCIFTDDLSHLGELIGNVIIRHIDPPCTLPSNWSSEKLSDQTARVLDLIHKFISERNLYLMMAHTRKKPFTVLAFTYLLPLLKVVLKDRGSVINANEGLRMKALQIIMVHCKLRSSPADDNVNSVQLLPRTELLQILSGVIIGCDGHNKDSKIQIYANNVFDEVCKSANGSVGCAKASLSEVELLLDYILSNCSILRHASLKGLLEMIDILPMYAEVLIDTLGRRVMIARYDSDKKNAELAELLWEKAKLTVSGGMTCDLVEDIIHPLADIRTASSMALATSLGEQPALAPMVISTLLMTYEEQNKIPAPVIDNLGRAVSVHFVDPWEARQGVALTLEKIIAFIPDEQVEVLFRFFVPTAFSDRNELVRKQMLDAALAYVNHSGQNHMTLLLSIFEEFLDSAPDSSAHDVIRQSVIILTGSLAKHLSKTDPKIKPIFLKLMAALTTPSQQVQEAVANCLPPLCLAIKDDAPDLIKNLLNQLFESESYGERRGAAFGLAGMAKGLGILSLKQHNIISTLNEYIQDKKVWRHREGALFAFETLCTMLGRLFEPYVVHLLPHLLLCFGDGNQYVREAADETAKAVMRNLSNHGVKLVLPSLLKALEEESWRTKTGSAELLGAMSFCAPKQLSSCLPSIVPRLTEILADSHLKVQKAGQQALRQIGGVIRNPEIQEISSIILDALSDPNKNTVACLQALLNTSFVHFIDAPSLALIMPTLEKALDQRPTETKKMAAQILGNMYALTDPKDLTPYLPAVVPGLKKSLLDPSPEVRGVSARALGAIVKGMGEECFNDLMPWLLETLTSEISSVDRSGAAQGLSEVLHALGQERLDKLMPDVIATTMKVELPPFVREGYLMLYIYLPATFGDDFIGYISSIVPAILKGLADESEYVRETSLKAGQRIINMYSESAIELLLPQLEAGLFDEHWRIRYSSVQLLGDLLFKLSGVTGKQSTIGDEDDNFGTAYSSQVILETLGQERRDRVYAGLYMGRSDVALHVRQSALHVWKVIVQNTAKTLRELLPTLFELLLGCLASPSYDKRQVAARTLGDLVRKLGERILPEIIPILEEGLNNEAGSKRQGVCIGLSEIMDSCSREMVGQFEESLISTVQKALLDPLPEVRSAASLTFENLHNTIGHKALEGVLPHVFEKLEDPDLSEFALDGLKQVMAVKSKMVLPFLIPKLTKPPVNTKALSILASVAGEALVKHLEKILPAMIEAVHLSTDNSEFKGTEALVLSVEEDSGIRIIINELTIASKNQLPGIRKVAADLLCVFCRDCRGDFSMYVQQLFVVAIQLMNDVDSNVTESGWILLDTLVKHLEPSDQIQHLTSLKQALKFIKAEIRNNLLPGFCLPKKGVVPIIPMFREGILNGPQEVKEQASLILGEIIKLTSEEALKPSVVHLTGPLIRILGDRFNYSVKVAILDTLGLLLEKVGAVLKPFFSQLQTTFMKALTDPTLAVRQKASWALGFLTVLHTRVDSLFTELKNSIQSSDDPAVRETVLKTLHYVIVNAGDKMGDSIKSSLLETLLDLISSTEDGIRITAGASLGALCQVLSDSDVKSLLSSSLLDVNPTLDWIVCHGRAIALSYALFHAPSQLFKVTSEESIIDVVVRHSTNERIPICTFGVHSLGHLIIYSKEKPSVAPLVVLVSMKKSMLHVSSDVRITALNTLRYISKNYPESVQFNTIKHFITEFPLLLRDRNQGVRSVAEITIAFVLQLHKNDLLFDQCVASLTECAKFLQDYKSNVFVKHNDALATDPNDYIFVT
ncbi:stalled ribosome sensor GCN1 isoform X1 [Hydra vulgaris]|uniref:stalled ribosome sensor GCN1 isoform X1 n=1 Tax=Hydra vulgaris TaxID=6087 RepID=UPI0032E9C49D